MLTIAQKLPRGGPFAMFAVAMKTIFASVMFAAVVTVGACHHQTPPPENAGPVQKAGAAVDHAATNVKDAAKDTGHDVKRDLTK